MGATKGGGDILPGREGIITGGDILPGRLSTDGPLAPADENSLCWGPGAGGTDVGGPKPPVRGAKADEGAPHVAGGRRP